MGASVHFLTCPEPLPDLCHCQFHSKSHFTTGRCSWCTFLNHPESKEEHFDVVPFMGAFVINLSTHSFLIPLMGYISELTSFCPRLLCWWLANWAYFSQCLLWLLWWDFPPLPASSPGIVCVPLYWFVWKMKTLLFFFFNSSDFYWICY